MSRTRNIPAPNNTIPFPGSGVAVSAEAVEREKILDLIVDMLVASIFEEDENEQPNE